MGGGDRLLPVTVKGEAVQGVVQLDTAPVNVHDQTRWGTHGRTETDGERDRGAVGYVNEDTGSVEGLDVDCSVQFDLHSIRSLFVGAGQGQSGGHGVCEQVGQRTVDHDASAQAASPRPRGTSIVVGGT